MSKNAHARWQLSLADLYAELETQASGLSADAVGRLRSRYTANVLQPHAERGLFRQLLKYFLNPLVLVLLAAGVVAAFLGDLRSFYVISVIVLLSVVLDFTQEYRAGRAAERLRKTVSLRASVLRDGQRCDVAIAELVPGDVVELAAGDRVAADGRLLTARDFFVNQSVLTGESFPVEKHAGDDGPIDDPSTDHRIVLMGTTVVSGSARMLVVGTGTDTALGQIADTLTMNAPPTAFELGTHAFGAMILRLTLFLVLFVLLVNAVLHRPLFESLLFAVALAVGLTPELLPMVISVTLSRGAMRLSKQRVIVKRLSAVQDLGAIDVLCTDKTGTLTEGRIQLERHVNAQGVDSERVLENVYLNSAFETGIRSPLDEAILRHKHIDISAWKKLDEVPFDFERRRVSVLVECGKKRMLVIKGSPEDVLRLCSHCEDADGDALPLDAANRKTIDDLYAAMSLDGFRVLAVAWRAVDPTQDRALLDDERDLVFSGFAAFLDPPKASARQALATLAAAGIRLKIVTGDNEGVTRHVCGQLGFEVAEVLNGPEIRHLDDLALQARVERANVFCRVTPAQKSRVLKALRARRHIVGFLGDGINDAPSLHAADVGISVDSAVDVAKEAADLILLDHDLTVLHAGVMEGRRTFGNVMKYIMMATSSNFGNMFSMAGGTVLLPFLPMLPIQILLNNFLYDLSEIAIPLDNVDKATLSAPQAWDMGFVRRFMLTLGPISSLFDFLTFYVLLHYFQADEALFHSGWFVESITTQVLVIFIIRTRGSPFAIRPGAWLVALSLGVVAVAAVLPSTGLAHLFGFVPLPTDLCWAIAGIVGAYLLIVHCAKLFFYNHLYPTTASAKRTRFGD